MSSIIYTEADGSKMLEGEKRAKRDAVRDAQGLLVQCDWTQLADTAPEVQASFAVYREQLRAVIAKANPDEPLPQPPQSVFRFE